MGVIIIWVCFKKHNYKKKKKKNNNREIKISNKLLLFNLNLFNNKKYKKFSLDNISE